MTQKEDKHKNEDNTKNKVTVVGIATKGNVKWSPSFRGSWETHIYEAIDHWPPGWMLSLLVLSSFLVMSSRSSFLHFWGHLHFYSCLHFLGNP